MGTGIYTFQWQLIGDEETVIAETEVQDREARSGNNDFGTIEFTTTGAGP